MENPHSSQGMRTRTTMMMKSGAAMPAAVNRITAAISPATVKRESRAPVFGPVDAPAGAEQEFEQVFHDTPACEMHRRPAQGCVAPKTIRVQGRRDDRIAFRRP